jgi:hypothetical protein
MNSVREKTDPPGLIQFPGHDETYIVIKIRRGLYMFLIWVALTFSPAVIRVPKEESKRVESSVENTLPPSKPWSPCVSRKSLPRPKPHCSHRHFTRS